MKLRIMAIILCLVMIVSALVACTTNDNGDGKDTGSGTTAGGNNTNTPTESVTDSYEQDDIPSDLKINRTLKMLYWEEHTNMEFFPKDQQSSGDTINDALIKREEALSSRLGVDIDFIPSPGGSSAAKMTTFIEKVAVDKEGLKEYDIVAGYSRTAPTLAMRGLSADLNELDYLNFNKPWWPSSLVNEMTVGDSLYFCSGDISTNLLWMMEATFYNMDLLKSYTGAEDPMQLVKENNWTFDKFFELCEGKYQSGDSEFYGCILYDVNIDAYQTSAGLFAVSNDNGTLQLSSSFGDLRISDLCDRLISFLETPDVKVSDKTSIRDLFFNQQALFTTDRVFIIYGKDNATSNSINFDYGVVPNPKLTAKQNYYTNVGHPFTMYSIPAYLSEEKKNDAAATLECLASESHRLVITPLFDIVMKARYTTDPVAREMFDIIRSSIVFEVGRIFNINDWYTANHFRLVILSGKNTWKSDYSKNKQIIESAIGEINTSLGG